MYIESIELLNFRNYSSLSLKPDPGTDLFYGDNAQGKTNILEAVYLAGTTKSHRGARDREMIRCGCEESHIRMVVSKGGNSCRIDMHLKKNKPKGIAIGGFPVKKAADLYGIVSLVFFSPEDLSIIKNGPGERRRFLDLMLCQMDKIYLSDLTAYNKCLNQRNRLLHSIFYDERLIDELDVWDEQLISYGKKIIEKRFSFIKELESSARDIHTSLTGGKEEIQLTYEPSVSADQMAEKIRIQRPVDLKFQNTSAGPHRDDFSVLLNHMNAKVYGSQGQIRTAALSLKLSEIELIKKKINDTPVLLLDDVLSELDAGRQRYLLHAITGIQTMITCTSAEELVKDHFHVDKKYHVVSGEVSE